MGKLIFRLIAVIFIVLFAFTGCKGDKGLKIFSNNGGNATERVEIKRFDKLLFETDINSLYDTLLKYEDEYRYLLNTSVKDTSYFSDIKSFVNDSVLKNVFKVVKIDYADLTWLEQELGRALAKSKELFPNRKTPIVYTLIGGDFDYMNRVRADSGYIAISLDYYSANKFEKYGYFGLSKYMLMFLDSANLLSDCMSAWATTFIPFDGKTLLDFVIFQGKVLYFMDQTIPEVPNERKIRYTPGQYAWCEKNEGLVWGLFIQKNLLYEQDPFKIRAFISEGPKTNMFNGSPARLADYIGWQIVKRYMENTKTSLSDLMKNTNSQQILTESGYKPKRQTSVSKK